MQSLKISYFLIVLGSAALLSVAAPIGSEELIAAQKSTSGKATLNGVTFAIPKGYAQIPQREIPNAMLLYYGKYHEGLFVAVPGAPFDKEQLLKSLTMAGIDKFFPRESAPFEWKPTSNHRQISKFEIGGDQAMGYNKKTLILVSTHHFRVAEKDIFLGDLVKWDNGEPGEVFARGLGAESMQGCNDMVKIVYSITGEKIDDQNLPCELIALPSSVK